MTLGYLFTKTLALVTLGGNLFVLLLIVAYIFDRPWYMWLRALIAQHALLLGTFIASAATLGSLVYSQVMGYPACILCWTQRIFMYPQMFILGLALWRRERIIAPYAFLSSILGGGVALYQWGKDMFALYGGITVPCPAVTGLPSCDRIYVLEFGYITIPMIALNAFVLIAIVMWMKMRSEELS